MFGIGNILQAALEPLEMLDSSMGGDFQSLMQQAGQGGGNGGNGSSIMSEVLPVVKEVLPIVAAAFL